MTQPNPDAVPEERRVRPFADVLVELNRGRTHAELSKDLQDLIAAVMDTGRKGTLTVQLTVAKSKASGQVEVIDNVVTKLPRPDRAASIFYVDDDANLTRTDPNQPELPIRDVSADVASRPLRDVGGAQ